MPNKNLEKRRTWARNYYLKNRDRIRGRRNAYYKAHRSECAAQQRAYKLAHPEQYRRYEERSRRLHPDIHKNRYLKCKFGITIEDYKKILQAQNGTCAICKTSELKKSRWGGRDKYFSVDHCHKTGKIRGLLCHRCNGAIAYLRDDVRLLQKAIEYLNR